MDKTVIYERSSGSITLDGVPLTLPKKEMELLVYLIEHADAVHTKEELIEAVWGYESLGQYSTLTVHVNRLRKKLESDPRTPSLIECVWGVGYKLRSDRIKII